MIPVIRNLGLQAYQPVWEAMQTFTLQRDVTRADELWTVEHPPVFTLGLNGKPEHLLQTTDIPLVQTDRGGQITYHAPGQLVVYVLIDVRRSPKSPRQLISALEQSMTTTLAQYGIYATAKPDAPGVYVGDKKIGSVGLRIKNGCSYHGLSLNNDMDLTPFQYINPCGYAGLQVTQLADFGIHISTSELAVPVISSLLSQLKL